MDRFKMPDDIYEPEIDGFAVMYDGELLEMHNHLSKAVDHAKSATMATAIADEMNFEKATIELVYETDEDGEVIWENDHLKTVEYNRQLNEWEIS